MARYSLYGLVIESELDLPGAAPDDGEAVPDVHISKGRVPDWLERAGGGHGDGRGGFVLNIEGTARYWIANHGEIIVDAEDGASEANVRLFLMGSTLGALLYLRGFLLLHANAVSIGGQAIAFAGPSGSGKSTLAMAFARGGAPVLSDDICAIDPSAMVQPGWRRMRLWDDAMAHFEFADDAHPPSYEGDPEYRKFDVPAPSEMPVAAPLRAIFVFDSACEDGFAMTSPAERAGLIVENLYRGEYLEKMDAFVDVMKRCAQLAADIELFRFRRLEGLARVDQDVDRMAAFLEGR